MSIIARTACVVTGATRSRSTRKGTSTACAVCRINMNRIYIYRRKTRPNELNCNLNVARSHSTRNGTSTACAVYRQQAGRIRTDNRKKLASQ